MFLFTEGDDKNLLILFAVFCNNNEQSNLHICVQIHVHVQILMALRILKTARARRLHNIKSSDELTSLSKCRVYMQSTVHSQVELCFLYALTSWHKIQSISDHTWYIPLTTSSTLYPKVVQGLVTSVTQGLSEKF